MNLSHTYYEVDCPRCQYTKLVRKTEYEDGQVLQCLNCFSKFTEYDEVQEE